jgi:hypothetical protein
MFAPVSSFVASAVAGRWLAQCIFYRFCLGVPREMQLLKLFLWTTKKRLNTNHGYSL